MRLIKILILGDLWRFIGNTLWKNMYNSGHKSLVSAGGAGYKGRIF